MNTLLYVLLLFSNPSSVILNEEKEIATVNRVDIANEYIDRIIVDERKLEQLFTTWNDAVFVQPKNAFLDQDGTIVKERAGFQLDADKMRALIYQFYYEGDVADIIIPKRNIYPRVDSELLAEISQAKLHEYVTHYQESNKERSHNIKLATEAIHNYVVFPGEIFSFNNVVGERTKERGYERAPVIVKGELAEDIGGGICQVSSTLFNAVQLKGIQITERYSHSRPVPYVPPGKDATVSWWGPDFAFENQYQQPVLIQAKAENGQMKIEIYSTEDVAGKLKSKD